MGGQERAEIDTRPRRWEELISAAYIIRQFVHAMVDEMEAARRRGQQLHMLLSLRFSVACLFRPVRMQGLRAIPWFCQGGSDGMERDEGTRSQSAIQYVRAYDGVAGLRSLAERERG